MSPASTRISASCQEIVSEDFSDSNTGSIVIQSNLADKKLWPVVADHKVHDITLVPSGLYGDMAICVARYCWQRLRPNQPLVSGLNVSDMQVEKTFIAQVPQPRAGEWLEMDATVELGIESANNHGHLRCNFRRIQPDGTKMHELASCSVLFQDPEVWARDWTAYQHHIVSLINNLEGRAVIENSGTVRTMHRKLAYELFTSFVQYDVKYQNMAQVIMNFDTLEATAQLDFQPDPVHDHTMPYYLDGSCHISGFVCNLSADSVKNAFISQGWEEVKLSPIFEQACREGTGLRTYVHMLPQPKDILRGDVFIVQDNEIIGVWEGVKFKRIPRRVLNVFLPPPKKT